MRLCKQCDHNAVEDEIHFLLLCPKFDNAREELFTNIKSHLCLNYHSLSMENKFIWLMSSEDANIIVPLAKFVSESLVIHSQ